MRIIESKYKTGKIITNFSSFVGYLNESQAHNAQEIAKKINRATLWISINKGFYGELLSHINIWGSYEIKPETMVTNGRDIIFHPDFIMSHTDEELRFSIMHEILHCISEHQERRENREMRWVK
jgi:predicted metal-dependent peptidase